MLRVSDFISGLVPGWQKQFTLAWPPDVFAIAAGLLHRSGAYTRVVMGNWPPGSGSAWARNMRKLGREWRKTFVDEKPPPARIKEWWNIVVAASGKPVEEVSAQGDLTDALIQLATAADEASCGLGFPRKHLDQFDEEAKDLLESPEGSTLCKQIDKSRCRVLPKTHTPQNGLTIRSLSHNLALAHTGDMDPRWYWLPTSHLTRRLNLLVIPWPLIIQPRQFSAAHPRRGTLKNMIRDYGFFDYLPSSGSDLPALVSELLESAENSVGPVDGIVLPEMAVSDADYEAVLQAAFAHDAFVIAGIHKDKEVKGDFGENVVRFNTKLVGDFAFEVSQLKHHRWLLDEGQIIQYHLGGNLEPSVKWWENIKIAPRQLNFLVLEQWLSMCVLVCEDLARQDPVSDIVRAVGPTLVVALLMDGPQLDSRWSARYATVLADDPGSSVLTLTSLGMVNLSRPPGKPPSRVIALWKDVRSPGSREIELPSGSKGVVLSLSIQHREEFTADGRSDFAATGFPILTGVHPV